MSVVSATIDQLLSVCQTGDNLDSRKEELREKRFNNRFDGIRKGDKYDVQKAFLEDMSIEDFEQSRASQMRQLYVLYRNESRTPRDGHPVDIFKSDVLYLDFESINAVCCLAKCKEDDINSSVVGLNSFQFGQVIDEMIACNSLIGHEIPYHSDKNSQDYYSRIVDETNVAKRAIDKYYDPSKVLKREHFSSLKDLLRSNASLVHRVSNDFKERLKLFSKDFESEKLGDQKVLFSYEPEK